MKCIISWVGFSVFHHTSPARIFVPITLGVRSAAPQTPWISGCEQILDDGRNRFPRLPWFHGEPNRFGGRFVMRASSDFTTRCRRNQRDGMVFTRGEAGKHRPSWLNVCQSKAKGQNGRLEPIRTLDLHILGAQHDSCQFSNGRPPRVRYSHHSFAGGASLEGCPQRLDIHGRRLSVVWTPPPSFSGFGKGSRPVACIVAFGFEQSADTCSPEGALPPENIVARHALRYAIYPPVWFGCRHGQER